MMLSNRMNGLIVLLAFAVLPGCGGDAGDGGEAEGADVEAQDPPVDLSNAGTLSGRVTFTGTAPQPEPIDMSGEPECADEHEGQPVRQVAAVGDDGGLGQVFVYVKEGIDQAWPTPGQAKVLDQQGCMYEPHVLGLQTGQTLEIRNSDGILHNINANPDRNRGFNISQPTTMTSERQFRSPEVMIPVRCDVHGWMEAYIGVVEHPYHAVTAEDGSFEIADLPPGEYTVEAWHERYGTQTGTATIEPNGTATLDFSYDESMAGRPVPMGEPLIVHHDGSHARASDGADAAARAARGS